MLPRDTASRGTGAPPPWYGPPMVVGLGIDLVETARVERSLARWGERLVRRLMSEPEASRLPAEPDERARALALAIAAKEAASKAIGTG